jgi:hypothetical protein
LNARAIIIGDGVAGQVGGMPSHTASIGCEQV